MPVSVIILAAGLGSRLRDAFDDVPKPLVLVGGEPILQRTIRGWLSAGADEVVVVTGHRAAHVQAHVRAAFSDQPVRCVVNPDFALSNGVSVLVGATARTHADFIISMSDHLLTRAVFARAVAHTPPNDGATLLVDPNITGVFDIDDATKVKTYECRIISIGKEISDFDCIDVGVFRCTEGLVTALQNARSATGDVSLSEGVDALAQSGRMTVVSIGDALWQDVDDAPMLAHAEQLLAAHPERFP